jgi:iron complex outermembrane receptor protein
LKNDNEPTGAYTNMVSRPGPDGRGVPLAPDDPFWGVAPGGDLFGYRDNDGDPHEEGYDFLGFLDREIYGGTGKLTWNIGGMALTAVTDYRRVDKAYAEDVESSPNPLLNYASYTDFEQFSQELRLNGELERMRWVGGVYYMTNDGYYVTKLWDAPLLTDFEDLMPGSTFDVTNPFDLDKETWSVFGQIEYDLGERVTLIGGVRYAHDDVEMSSIVYDPGSPAVGGVFTLFQVFDESTVGGLADTKEGLVNWKAQLEWRPLDDVLLYAGVTEGTKGPGFSGNLDATKALTDIPYDSETLRNYEGGVKSLLWDGKARVNASIYHYDYSDYQSFDLSGLVTRIENVDAKITGVEFDLLTTPWEGWEFTFGGNFLFTAEADDVPLGAGFFDREMPMAPDLTLNGVARYSWPAFNGIVTAQGDFNYVSSQNFAIQNHATTAADDYVVGNARLSWMSDDGHWDVAFFVNNVADAEYKTYAVDVSVFSITQVQYGKPRWFGGQVRYSWE